MIDALALSGALHTLVLTAVALVGVGGSLITHSRLGLVTVVAVVGALIV